MLGVVQSLVLLNNDNVSNILKAAMLCKILLSHRQLLHECGIGVVQEAGEGDLTSTTAAVCQHRMLIFCQIKSMLDIIEQHLFK